LVIGRRGMGKIKRLLVGSTSRYCVEHANCNVMVIKGEWGPSQVHSSLQEVINAEEEERKRRVEESDLLKEQHPVESVHLDLEQKNS